MGELPIQLQQRVYLSDLQGELFDLRHHPDAAPILSPDSWQAGQAFGLRLREEGADGIVYPSVRDPDGDCAAVLRPPVMSATRQGRHLGYDWDGERIRYVLELTWVV